MSIMDDKDLKACPFCGGDASFTVTGYRYPFRVVCMSCGALAGGTNFENNDYNGGKWNNRVEPPQ